MTPPDSEYQWPPATSRPLLHPLLTPVIKRQTQIGSTEHSVMQSASANLHPTTAPPSHPLSDRHRPICDGRSPRSSMGCQQTACPRPTESIPSGCHRLAIPRRDRRVPVGGSKLQEHCVVGWTIQRTPATDWLPFHWPDCCEGYDRRSQHQRIRNVLREQSPSCHFQLSCCSITSQQLAGGIA